MVHANTPRAGLMGSLARGLGGPPLVVRAHEALPDSTIGREVRRVLARSAGAVADRVPGHARSSTGASSGHWPPMSTTASTASASTPRGCRRSMFAASWGIPADAPLLGQVAQITPWKGQDTSIRALAQLRESGIDAHLLIVGQVAFSGQGAFATTTRATCASCTGSWPSSGSPANVHFLGQRDDVPALLPELDLSLLPSWDEPFANVMLESMAMGTPPLVSEVGGGPELIEEGVSGRLLAPKRPEVWAAAVSELLTTGSARPNGRAGPGGHGRFQPGGPFSCHADCL